MKKRMWKRMRKRNKVIERPKKREAAGRVAECTMYPIQLASSFLYHHHNYHTSLSNSTDTRNFNIFQAIDVTVVLLLLFIPLPSFQLSYQSGCSTGRENNRLHRLPVLLLRILLFLPLPSS